MRIMMILAAGATLAFAMAANAQTPSTQAPAQPPAAAPAPPSAAPTGIKSVTVVDVQELPEATQKQVNDIVAQRGDADLQQLRSSIDTTPEIKSALEAKGLTSAHVIAASMSPDGALTLTRKAG